MNKSLRQLVSDFCSRWRVEMSPRGPLAQIGLCAAFPWEEEEEEGGGVTGRSSLCLQPAVGERAGAGPAILCGKFRTGHEPAICSSRPSAAKRSDTSDNGGRARRLRYVLDGRRLTRRHHRGTMFTFSFYFKFNKFNTHTF